MKFKCSKRSIFVLFLTLLITSILFSVPKRTSKISRAMHHMNSDDRHYLTIFLRSVLFSDSFAYLLFGSKPISITNFEKSFPFAFSRHFGAKSDFDINKGLKVFRRHENLFSSENIIVHFSEDAEMIDFLMINKRNLLKTLQEHIDDFKQVLGSEITPESLFTQLTEMNEIHDLFDVIDNHAALFGILLGYGRENSWLFHQKSMLFRKMNQFKPPLKQDSSLEEKFAEIDRKGEPFNDIPREGKYILQSPLIPLPQFMAVPTSLETKKLKKKYKREREEIKKIFAKQGLIEGTFEQLMEERHEIPLNH